MEVLEVLHLLVDDVAALSIAVAPEGPPRGILDVLEPAQFRATQVPHPPTD